jgi:phage gp46-like protein
MINMLMTDGRQADTACGYRPNGQGGHWSESYIDSGDPTVGTLMRTIAPAGRVQALEAQLEAYAKQTLQKLVGRGVARSVDVVVKYVSGGNFSVNASVFGVDNRASRIGLSAQRLENGWVWNNT